MASPCQKAVCWRRSSGGKVSEAALAGSAGNRGRAHTVSRKLAAACSNRGSAATGVTPSPRMASRRKASAGPLARASGTGSAVAGAPICNSSARIRSTSRCMASPTAALDRPRWITTGRFANGDGVCSVCQSWSPGWSCHWRVSIGVQSSTNGHGLVRTTTMHQTPEGASKASAQTDTL